MYKRVYLILSSKSSSVGGNVLNYDELKLGLDRRKWDLVAKVKTFNFKQPVLILIALTVFFAALELLGPLVEARWGVRWGGWGGWGRWGGWSGSSGWWGGWGRPWYSGWRGWW